MSSDSSFTRPAKLILDLCGGTGAWSHPYAEAGYDVIIVDPWVNGSDVRTFNVNGLAVHGILAAPPCTEFAASGARWWKTKPPERLQEALAIVQACLRIIREAEPKWWALENPVGRLPKFIGPYQMTFNPCDYGDPYTKKTCLWGKFKQPAKRPVEATCGSRMWTLSPSKDRPRLRSITPPGFARAFFEANP